MEKHLETLITKEELDARITELANEIDREFAGKTLTVICVLKGAVIFMCDLVKKLKLDTELEFMTVSSYDNDTESTGNIRVKKDLDQSIKGKDVLLVEDILDTGHTLKFLIDHLKAQKPNTFKVCTLLDKPERREVSDVAADYVGFTIPNVFIVGYGLDDCQKCRNIPYITHVVFE